ncbi:MAG: hypothetical protein J7K00_05140 [Candidatus Diapherotrites archaeon]|nr:hypothetical protein [Candidatus Diapherotrites archaeon]
MAKKQDSKAKTLGAKAKKQDSKKTKKQKTDSKKQTTKAENKKAKEQEGEKQATKPKPQKNTWKTETRKLYFMVMVCFLFTQLLGLYVSQSLSLQQITVTENPEEISNSFEFFGLIIIMTAIMIAVIRLKIKVFLKIIETIAVFFASVLVFSAFVPELPAIALAGLVLVLKTVKKTIATKNMSAVLAIAGVGGILGASLGVLPAIVFLLILSLYDIIAVFFTKHMVEMAKSIIANDMAFTLSFPVKNRIFELGTGDLVMPLIFAAAVLNAPQSTFINFGTVAVSTSLIKALFVCFGALSGLVVVINLVERKKGRMLPALPPIVAGALVFFVAGTLLFG